MSKQLATLIFALVVHLTTNFHNALAGVLRASGSIPIVTSFSNEEVLSDYTFKFSPETTIPAGGLIKVIFPSQYRTGLGIPLSPSCSVPCEIDEYTVTFTLEEQVLAGASAEVTIEDVENPTSKGGTGNFQVTSYKGVNVLDENLIFDVIGIAGVVGQLTATIISLDTGSTSIAGAVATYKFAFKTTQEIPSGSSIRIEVLDTNFGIEDEPTCSAYAINGYTISGSLSCSASNSIILVEGLSSSIPKLKNVGLKVELTNPGFSGTTPTFTISILRTGTNAIYDRKEEIAGPTIEPGAITNIDINPVISGALPGRSKKMEYDIEFQPTNALTTSSIIELKFPSTFILTNSGFNRVMSGLEDISASSPIGIAVDLTNNLITISNFQAQDTPALITVRVRVTNPPSGGSASAIRITTYQTSAKSKIVDQDSTTAVISVSGTGITSSNSILTASTIAETVMASLEFQVQPTNTVPVSGYVTIRIDPAFTLGTAAPVNCQVNPDNAGYAASASCTSTGSEVSVVLPTQFTSGQNSYVRLDNLLTAPVKNGTYVFDLTTYDAGNSALDSWTNTYLVTGKAFAAFTATSYGQDDSVTTVISFDITTTADIVPASDADPAGSFELQFDGALGDLGTGLSSGDSLPCNVDGITAISGLVSCTLFTSSGDTPTIRITNFQEVPASTAITISIPNFQNPLADYDVTVKAISKELRVRTDINVQTTTMTIQAAAAIGETGAIANSFYTFSNNELTQLTDLQMTPGTTNPYSDGYFIFEFPHYDIGWIAETNTITCAADAVLYACERYPGIDWIVIPLSGVQTIAAGAVFDFTDLQVPRYLKTSLTPVVRFVSNTDQREKLYRTQQDFPASTIPAFNTASFTTSKQNEGAVDVTYTFTLESPNIIPEGASIVISTPAAYDLLEPYPVIEYSSSILVAVAGSSISYSSTSNSIIVSNFQELAAGTEFTITAEGVRNPTGISVSQIWVAKVTLDSYTMIQSSGFDSFGFTPEESTGSVVIDSISVFPLNAAEDADYQFTFTPSTSISAGGSIKITFPSTNYNSLISPPVCDITGAVESFASCTLAGSIFTLELDEDYTTGAITVTIFDIENPSSAMTTDGFEISTYYDGFLLAETDTSTLSGRTVTIQSAGNYLDMTALDFEPKNEGEQATYFFEFIPTTTITTSMAIYIKFPDVYDPRLGDDVTCQATDGLSGDISCSIEDRVVTIVNFDQYTPSSLNPIAIELSGIVNSNLNVNSNTGQFKVGTYTKGTSYFIDYESEAGVLEMQSAPGWCVLTSITSTNTYARRTATYTFTFTSFDSIPSDSLEGQILIDFPNQFDIPEDSNLGCESSNLDFGTSLDCSVSSNRISVSGNENDFSGTLTFSVRAVTNPVQTGDSDNILIKTYDGADRLIIERSYKNLDPFYFTYSFQGPLITINEEDDIYVDLGTQSVDIPVYVEYPCALNLTLKPTPSSGFTVVPFNVDYSMGSVTKYFRVSAPVDFNEGTYQLEWSVFGELVPAYYTPIKKTTVIVTALGSNNIEIPTLFDIPIGGSSLYSTISLDNAPDSDLVITLTLDSEYPGITIKPQKQIIISAGTTSTTFRVLANSTTLEGSSSFTVTLSGTDASVYTLSTDTISFNVIASDTVEPQISSLSIDAIQRTSIDFTVTASEIVNVYYMIALAGTAEPPNSELEDSGPAPYLATESVYGKFQVTSGGGSTSHTHSGLAAETPYVLYVSVEDRGGSFAGPILQNFTTANRYDAAEVQITISKPEVNNAEIQVVRNAVAFALSLYSSLVSFKTNTSSATDNVLTLMIETQPLSTDYPSPLDMGLLLDDKKDELQEKYADIDTSAEITASLFQRYTPSFTSSPSVAEKDYQKIVISTGLTQDGYVIVGLIENNSGASIITPTPYQIWKGLKADCQEMDLKMQFRVATPGESELFEITGVEPETTYYVAIIGGSIHPGYPDLMSESSIVVTEVTTDPLPVEGGETERAGIFSPILGLILLMSIAILF